MKVQRRRRTSVENSRRTLKGLEKPGPHFNALKELDD
jgi:hypothetical protein